MRPIEISRRRLLVGCSALLGTSLSSAALALGDDGGRHEFLVVGDWGRDGHAHQVDVAHWMGLEARRNDCAFTVSTGDNFYNLGVASCRSHRWDSSFNAIYTAPSLQHPWYPVLGNHDYGGNVQAQVDRTAIDGRWTMPARWHKVTLSAIGKPTVDLVFIDTVVWRGREKFPYSILGSRIEKDDQAAQVRWLTDALLSSTARIKIVFGHHPIYSVGKHGGAKDMVDLDDLLKRAGVTAYVCGHDHCLYHINTRSMDYICSGGGSQELTAFTGDPAIAGCVLTNFCSPTPDVASELPVWRYFGGTAGFAAISVGSDDLSFRFIDRHGQSTAPQHIAARFSSSPALAG